MALRGHPPAGHGPTVARSGHKGPGACSGLSDLEPRPISCSSRVVAPGKAPARARASGKGSGNGARRAASRSRLRPAPGRQVGLPAPSPPGATGMPISPMISPGRVRTSKRPPRRPVAARALNPAESDDRVCSSCLELEAPPPVRRRRFRVKLNLKARLGVAARPAGPPGGRARRECQSGASLGACSSLCMTMQGRLSQDCQCPPPGPALH